MLSDSPIMLWLVIFTCFSYSTYLYLRAGKRLRLPPGPRGIPLFGNAFQLPSTLLFLKLDEWKDQFGEIFSLNIAGQAVVVLNTAAVAADVFDRQSALTTDRPEMAMPTDIMTRNGNTVLVRSGDRWRRGRRLMHEALNTRVLGTYYSSQEDQAIRLVQGFLGDSADPEKLLVHAAGAMIWRALYSDAPLSKVQKESVAQADHFAHELVLASAPTSYLVNIFPILKYLPTWVAPWKKYGEDFFLESDSHLQGLFQRYRNSSDANTAFVTASMDLCTRIGINDQEAAWVLGMLFVAGVETTATVMHSFVLAMLLNPDIARKAQEEIDDIVGTRFPTFADRDQLPFVQAIMKETLRWRPPGMFGIPHRATESFMYKDYLIPKGVVLLGNLWSINRDPIFFPDYDVFRPERFLNEKGRIKEPNVDYHDDLLSFGWGRRICPGKDFAANSMFIQMVCLLWACDFRKPVDANGREVHVSAGFRDTQLTTHSAPFECIFHPRQPNLANMLTTYHEKLGI